MCFTAMQVFSSSSTHIPPTPLAPPHTSVPTRSQTLWGGFSSAFKRIVGQVHSSRFNMRITQPVGGGCEGWDTANAWSCFAGFGVQCLCLICKETSA